MSGEADRAAVRRETRICGKGSSVWSDAVNIAFLSADMQATAS